MESNKINILMACDKNYSPYYGVMLTSLFRNNESSSFHIHWITDKFISQNEKNKFLKLVNKYRSQLSIYEIDNSSLTDFPQRGHLNYAAYYNLKASEILPQSIHRIIYMDGDMIVNGDIRPIWELDLQGNICAQVLAASYYEESQYERLGFDKKYGVSNNGIVLYDLDKMREMNFSQKAIQFISENPEKAIWMDQDTINALLYNKTLRLPFYYNFQTLAMTKEYWRHFDNSFRAQVLEASKNPIVIHYTGHDKPWSFRYYGYPFGQLWDDYCKMSYWKTAKQRKPLIKYIKYLMERLLLRSFFKERCDAIHIEEAWELR